MSSWDEIGCFLAIFWVFFSADKKRRLREQARQARADAEVRRNEAWDAQLRRAEDIEAGAAERPVGPAWERRTRKVRPLRTPQPKVNVDPMTGKTEPIEPDGTINEGDVRNGPGGYVPGAYHGGVNGIQMDFGGDDEGQNR